MNVFFPLWDTDTGNLATEFASEDEAADRLPAPLSTEGQEPFLELALLRFEAGHPTLVAKHHDLIHDIARSRSLTTATGT